MKKFSLFFLFLLLICSPLIKASELSKSAESYFVRVNGIRMHYATMGCGPLVILIHGWPETSYEWREVMPLLAKNFKVVAPDLRGLGYSEKTATGYDKLTIANDIAALISSLHQGPAFVVGHDMGGKVACFLALLHPELVKKLVLVDCLIPGTENTDPMHQGSWHYGFHMAPEFPEMLTQGREKKYITAIIQGWLYNKRAVSQKTFDQYAKCYRASGGMTAGFNYYRALPQDAAFLSAHNNLQFKMPVMTIAGRYGVGNKLYNEVKKHSSSVKNVIIEESGHFVPEEAPDVLAKQLRDFFICKN